MTAPTEAVARAMARATAPTLHDGDGWETTAAVLAFEVGRLRDALDAAEMRDRAATNLARSAQVRAERAEAALARVEALAESFAADACDGSPESCADVRAGSACPYDDAATRLRAALNGAAR